MSAALFVSAVWRYPVKGLGGESLARAEVSAGRGICGDRRYMIAAADVAPLISGREKWHPWNYGPTIKRDARLAALRASLHNGELTIRARGGEEVRGRPEDENERRRIEEFVRDFLGDNSLFLADCERRPAWDYKDAPLTALFSESLSDLSCFAGAPAEAERFRANIVIDGGAAREEMNHLGGALRIGEEAELTALSGVERCAATRVNPRTGGRDINIPEMLIRRYRSNEMGIKCATSRGGAIAVGDRAHWI